MSDAARKTPEEGGITVAEMTRRRDHWREVASRMQAALMSGLLRANRAERELIRVRNDRNALIHQLSYVERELAASQAEARRFAEQVGVLHDRLKKGN